MTCLLGTTHVTNVTHDVILSINKMLSKEDRVLIKVLRVDKGYGQWCIGGVYGGIRRIPTSGFF